MKNQSEQSKQLPDPLVSTETGILQDHEQTAYQQLELMVMDLQVINPYTTEILYIYHGDQKVFSI